MTHIYDIRGTNGSGKSHVVHQLLNSNETREITDNGRTQGIYIPSFQCAVLGQYKTVCGGCDQLPNANSVNTLVREFLLMREIKVIVLEGLLVSHTFQRYHDLAVEVERKGHRYNFLFLDTPLELCISRVESRRETKKPGQPKFNPRNLIKDFHQIDRVRLRMIEAGRSVKKLNHTKAVELVQEMIRDSYNQLKGQGVSIGEVQP